MTTTRDLIKCAVVALAFYLAGHGCALADPIYTIQELLPLPGHSIAHANAINESGQVVGYSYAPGPHPGFPADGARLNATFWHQGEVLNIGAQSGFQVRNAIDINDLTLTLDFLAMFLASAALLLQLSIYVRRVRAGRDLGAAAVSRQCLAVEAFRTPDVMHVGPILLLNKELDEGCGP